ncbi:MAG: squalene/phytoene synthase family protein [Steroidobacteraceae bacterium]
MNSAASDTGSERARHRSSAGAIEQRSLAGSARDFAWLYSPAPLRAVLGPLLDIEREIGVALRPGLDHGVAHVRLAWWRDECGRCAAGHPAHRATRALLAAAGGPVDAIGLVQTAEWDLAAATFETRGELAAYCERWASAVTGIAAQRAAFGRAFGAALKEIELLTGLTRDARVGRLRLPLDELKGAGIDPSGLAQAPWTPALGRLVAARHRAARTALAQSLASLSPADQPALRGLLVWGALAARASKRAEGTARRRPAPAGPPDESGRSHRLADAWQAWRAARRADRRRFQINQEDST